VRRVNWRWRRHTLKELKETGRNGMKPSIKSGIVLVIIVVAVFLVALNSKNEGMGGVSGK